MLIITIILIFSVGCYDKFDSYVLGKMGIEEPVSEQPSSEKKETKKNNKTETKLNVKLHSPSDPKNTVRLGDTQKDHIKGANYQYYTKGCYWEIESNAKGQDVARRMYDSSGNELESYVYTYGKDKHKYEILKEKHMGPNHKSLGSREIRYNSADRLESDITYDGSGKMIKSIQYVYEKDEHYQERLVKRVDSQYKDGKLLSSTERSYTKDTAASNPPSAEIKLK